MRAVLALLLLAAVGMVGALYWRLAADDAKPRAVAPPPQAAKERQQPMEAKPEQAPPAPRVQFIDVPGLWSGENVQVGAVAYKDKMIVKTFAGTGKTDADCLGVMLVLYAIKPNRKIDYSGWVNDPRKVALRDEFGNKYRMLRPDVLSEIPLQSRGGSIQQGVRTPDHLVFEPPVLAATRLELLLPASAFGEQGFIAFRIDTATLLDFEKTAELLEKQFGGAQKP